MLTLVVDTSYTVTLYDYIRLTPTSARAAVEACGLLEGTVKYSAYDDEKSCFHYKAYKVTSKSVRLLYDEYVK